ncbi:MAG: tetratricopeptide repeat protein [Bdellovibrionia bacterium]
MRSKPFKKALQNQPAWIFLLFAIWGALIYGHSLTFGFILDDQHQILDHPLVHSFDRIPEIFSHSSLFYEGQPAGVYYKPVMILIYNLIWHLSPENAFGFHLFQLVIHTLNGWLVFLLFSKLLKHPLISLLTGLVFLVHPMNSEVVLMIANLQDGLFTFFGLLALLQIGRSNRLHLKEGLFAFVLLLLSLLSKETGALYCWMALVWGILDPPSWDFPFSPEGNPLKTSTISAPPQERKSQLMRPWREQRPFWVLFGSVLCAYLSLRWGVAHLGFFENHQTQMMRASFFERLLCLPQILSHYFFLFFFPKDLTLTQDWGVTTANWEQWGLPWICFTGGCFVLWKLWLKPKPPSKSSTWIHSRLNLFFLLWVVFGMGLHAQLIPLDGTVSDRWFTFPMIGFLGLLSQGLLQPTGTAEPSPQSLPGALDLLPTRIRSQKFFLSLGLLLALSARSWVRSLNWSSPLTLYSHDVQIIPNTFYIQNNLGLELLQIGQIDQARDHFLKTIELSIPRSDNWSTAWRNLAATELRQKKWKQALEAFEKAMENPADSLAHLGFALTLFQAGQIPLAQDFLQKVALQRFPENPRLLRFKQELDFLTQEKNLPSVNQKNQH